MCVCVSGGRSAAMSLPKPVLAFDFSLHPPPYTRGSDLGSTNKNHCLLTQPPWEALGWPLSHLKELFVTFCSRGISLEVMLFSGGPGKINVCVAGQRTPSEGVPSVLLGLAWLCHGWLCGGVCWVKGCKPPHYCPTRGRQQGFGFWHIHGNWCLGVK